MFVQLNVGQIINKYSCNYVLKSLYSCSNCLPHRVGVYQADVFRAVSDTTNSALKAGQLIADGRVATGGTTCIMHAQELCLKHALGIAVRKKNNMIIDEFPSGKL